MQIAYWTLVVVLHQWLQEYLLNDLYNKTNNTKTKQHKTYLFNKPVHKFIITILYIALETFKTNHFNSPWSLLIYRWPLPLISPVVIPDFVLLTVHYAHYNGTELSEKLNFHCCHWQPSHKHPHFLPFFFVGHMSVSTLYEFQYIKLFKTKKFNIKNHFTFSKLSPFSSAKFFKVTKVKTFK